MHQKMVFFFIFNIEENTKVHANLIVNSWLDFNTKSILQIALMLEESV